MNSTYIYQSANNLLKQIYGQSAIFRDGQYEAIETTLLNKRSLVVQKTGWGKSLVYFISAKLLRQSNQGITLVISPLLVLMDNQMQAAKKMGLKCDALNGNTRERRKKIIDSMVTGNLDLVFITPETLFANEVQLMLKYIKIGLFVIDEAHCISDWGHDFRLQYGNIYKILNAIPHNVPVLATTATANDRVVEDLRKQLGGNVFVSRGELMRKSLSIQVLNLSDTASRYAWILENINKLGGSGIIYCLTQRDCDYLASFLLKNKIKARSYYSRSEEEEQLNLEAERLFQGNKIKVIIATIKLGMGYDKGDISFVIHFQQPSNIVSYYQQIGRAGRNIERAYTFIMTGAEDREIQNFFINTAFPTREECESILNYIFEYTDEGVSLSQIISNINLRKSRIDKALMFLQNEGYIIRDKNKYYSTIKAFIYDEDHYNSITNIRKKEQAQMNDLISTTGCYNKFIVNCLDDPTTQSCGICKNCLGYEEFSLEVSNINLEKAQIYLEKILIPIEPRKRWASTSITKQTNIGTINELGICLSKYGDPGYGKLVKQCKYSKEKRFCDELVGKSIGILKEVIKENGIQAITSVPSLRSDIVEDFAIRVAERCELPYLTTIEKNQADQQNLMQNASHQCENALRSFHIIKGIKIPENIILIDDIIDSKWTMTVCGNLLTSAGASKIFPFALADSSNKEI